MAVKGPKWNQKVKKAEKRPNVEQNMHRKKPKGASANGKLLCCIDAKKLMDLGSAQYGQLLRLYPGAPHP